MIALDLHTFFGLPMAAICSLLSTSFGAREPIFKCAFSDNGVSFRRRWWCLHRQGVDRACVDGSNAGILVCLCQELPNTTCPSPSPASLPSLLETTISGENVRGNLSTRDQFDYFVGPASCYCRRVELTQTAAIREHIKNYGGRRWWRLRYLSGIENWFTTFCISYGAHISQVSSRERQPTKTEDFLTNSWNCLKHWSFPLNSRKRYVSNKIWFNAQIKTYL